MPKPKSPERPPMRQVVPKSSRAPRASIPVAEDCYDNVEQEVEDVQFDDVETSTREASAASHPTGIYPPLIRQLLSICVGEASDVRGNFKNRKRTMYKNIFDKYKDRLSARDYSIVKGALFYLYEFSRIKSIDKDTAEWMIGIYEIPTSQIISYTSKEVLKTIAKENGLPYSNKKAEDLVQSIRGVIDPSR